jgi:hypothetical protein
MAKTKKNVQKKRRQLRKKTRDGRGKSAYISQATRARRAERDSYRPTNYDVMLGDDNSVFSHLFVDNPKREGNFQYVLINAIRNYRNLPERDDYPTRVLDAWHYELRTKPDTTQYIFVPRRTVQTNDFQTGYITFTFVKSPFEPE